MEKLHDSPQGRYDLLVVDTPPTRNALDFLDAPKKKLLAFIDSRTCSPGPGMLGLKVLGAAGMVLSVLKRATGVDLLEDLCTFFASSATWPKASASAPSA